MKVNMYTVYQQLVVNFKRAGSTENMIKLLGLSTQLYKQQLKTVHTASCATHSASTQI